ncbi:DMT family transporter [Paenibacillus sp. TRM 82003]|nr:DMT family transporter [Paenibacillus sp. TRM 82003]
MWMLYALLAAICFGFRGILYHWSSQRPMNRNVMLFGVFCTGALLCFAIAAATGQRFTQTALIGVGMGTFSFAASASMYQGFAVGKTSLVAMLTGLPPVVVAVLAYLIWGETLAGWKLAAFGIILLSVVLLRYSNDLSFKNLQGAQWGLLAMLFFGLNDIAGKQSTLLGADMLPTLTCMFATGAAWFGLWWRLGLRRASRVAAAAGAGTDAGSGSIAATETAAASVDGSWSAGRTFLWGMVVGLTNATGMMAILAAFQSGVTGLVSAVVALNVLIILGYSRIFTKEKFKRLEVAGIALSLIGIVLLRLAP